MLNGPDGYFKTYQDFVKGNFVPFEKVMYKDAWKGKPLSIWFTTKGQKTEFETPNIWGYRKENQLYRITSDVGAYGGLWRVIAIGDWVLYLNPYYYAALDKDKPTLTYSSDAFTCYSKNLESAMSYGPDAPKTEKTDKDHFSCDSRNITACFLENVHINFVLALASGKAKSEAYEYKEINTPLKSVEKTH